MSNFSLQCTALTGTNKVGKLKPDSNGYYPVVLGGFDIPNPRGDVYPYKAAEKLFEESSTLMRNIGAGTLYGEWGHPKRQPGQSLSNYLKRCSIIDEANIAFHIKKIEINKTDVKDEHGNPVVVVMGWVKGSGPSAKTFNEMLENPDQNVCFSIRATTYDVPNSSGKLDRNLATIVTWDFVVYPGLKVAQKYLSPALESFEQHEFTKEDLMEAKKELGGYTPNFAMENAPAINVIDEILSNAPKAKRDFSTKMFERRTRSTKWK